MASSSEYPLLVAGFEKPKRAAKTPRKVMKSKGEKSVTASSNTQVGELAYSEPKPPSHQKMMKNMAREQKLHATRRWISGELSNSAHKRAHARADSVLKGSKYFGKGHG